MANRAVISLGSNIDKEKNLPTAIKMIGSKCRLMAVSNIYETAPASQKEQAKFWNAAVLIETELGPADLRELILAPIETKLNRIRTADKYASRTIDVDLTLFNDEIIDLDKTHHIPDPDLLRFIHVAKPVSDLIPDTRHPETGQSFKKIAMMLQTTMDNKERRSLKKVSEVDLRKLLA
jgi:2-amino-4-hydroxy-6-hydroxymethyldihydropteridine diphosphokinase